VSEIKRCGRPHIPRYGLLEQTHGKYVLFSDHEATLAAAVQAEREKRFDEVMAAKKSGYDDGVKAERERCVKTMVEPLIAELQSIRGVLDAEFYVRGCKEINEVLATVEQAMKEKP
jgi:hypothetical protein